MPETTSARAARLQDAVDGQVHAVGGRPVDGVAPRPQLLDAQRAVQREGVADRAPLAVGCGDDHLPERAHRLRQRRDPLRVDPIVVGDEDERRGAHDAAHVATKDRPLQPEAPPRDRAVAWGRSRVGASRFERPTTRTPSECATWLRHAPALATGLRRGPAWSQGERQRDDAPGPREAPATPSATRNPPAGNTRTR